MEQTQALVIIENKVPLADSRMMAVKLNIQHQNLLATIVKYQPKIERKLGVVLFMTDLPPKGSKGGQPQKYAKLTEGQAYFVVTLCDNTDFAIDLREELVIKFLAAKQEIIRLQQQLQSPLQGDLWQILNTPDNQEFNRMIARMRRLRRVEYPASPKISRTTVRIAEPERTVEESVLEKIKHITVVDKPPTLRDLSRYLTKIDVEDIRRVVADLVRAEILIPSVSAHGTRYRLL